MTLDKAKTLTLSLFSAYPWDSMVARNRLIFETMEDLLTKGYTFTGFSKTRADKDAAEKAIEDYAHANRPRWQPTDITDIELRQWETSIIMGLLRNPPANAPKPSEGYTQADMDAAYNEGYQACQAAVARLRP